MARKRFGFILFSVILFLAWASPAGGGEAAKKDPSDPLEAWWKTARRRIAKILEDQGRTPEAIESPKWFEQAYNTVGRMPLIDTCLARPLVMPEVAGYADKHTRKGGDSLEVLFWLAHELCNQVKHEGGIVKPGEMETVKDFPKSLLLEVTRVKKALETNEHTAKLPAALKTSLSGLLLATGFAIHHRRKAFAGFSEEEKKRIADLLPAYFVKPSPTGESIRGYTTNVDDCVELIRLLRRVNFRELIHGAGFWAAAIDNVRKTFKAFKPEGFPAERDALCIELETAFGKIAIGGVGPNTYREDYVVLIDLGGDDLYLNHASAWGGTTSTRPGTIRRGRRCADSVSSARKEGTIPTRESWGCRDSPSSATASSRNAAVGTRIGARRWGRAALRRWA
ncbi:MAG: hypothetical protein ACYTHN_01550 [Planctomycetota bacterium]